LRYGERPHNRFLGREVSGFAAGLLYYLRHNRTKAQ